MKAPIGIFDSGYGGLSVLEKIRETLPQYDYLYMGDNARSPYGSRSFELVYAFTLESVRALFDMGCHLVVLACNTASAKALRSIQQRDLPHMGAHKRVLGVIRPTVEALGSISESGHVGIFGTEGTILSGSYELEISKFFPELIVSAEACPMWVPLVENNEINNIGADYFVQQHVHNIMNKDPLIDTIILACTHYPLLIHNILKFTAPQVRLMSQGSYVAESLKNYLQRHPEIAYNCSEQGSCTYLTTGSASKFSAMASLFLRQEIEAKHIDTLNYL